MTASGQQYALKATMRDGAQARQNMVGRWDKMFVMSGAMPDYEPSSEKSIAAIGAAVISRDLFARHRPEQSGLVAAETRAGRSTQTAPHPPGSGIVKIPKTLRVPHGDRDSSSPF